MLSCNRQYDQIGIGTAQAICGLHAHNCLITSLQPVLLNIFGQKMQKSNRRTDGSQHQTGLLLLLLCCMHVSTGSAQLSGLGYSHFGVQSFCLDETTIRSDVAQIAKVTQRIRIYGCACTSTDAVLARAEAHRLQVLLGVWLSADEQANEQELAGLQRLVTRWGPKGPGLIFSVAAGNEVLSVNGGQLVHLLQYMDRIRAMVQPYNIPLTYVDIPSVWLGTHPSMASPPAPPPPPPTGNGSTAVAARVCPAGLSMTVCSLLQRVDWVGANIHPYYEGLPVSCEGLNITGCYDGPTWVLGRVNELQRKLGTMNVIVTEVGWPSAGEACCDTPPSGFPSTARFLAKPSPANAAAHLEGLTQTLDGDGVGYFYFEAFDAAWKRTWSPCSCANELHQQLEGCRTTCSYDYNWGLWDDKRQPKSSINLTAFTGYQQSAPSGSSSSLSIGGSGGILANAMLWHSLVIAMTFLLLLLHA